MFTNHRGSEYPVIWMEHHGACQVAGLLNKMKVDDISWFSWHVMICGKACLSFCCALAFVAPFTVRVSWIFSINALTSLYQYDRILVAKCNSAKRQRSKNKLAGVSSPLRIPTYWTFFPSPCRRSYSWLDTTSISDWSPFWRACCTLEIGAIRLNIFSWSSRCLQQSHVVIDV